MNLTFFLHRCFERQLNFGIYILRIIGNNALCERQHQFIERQPEGSIGYILHHTMKQKNIRFVPGYQGHDLKHIILEYPMEPCGEIKMQAFMFGNCGFSLFSIITFLMFVIYVPEIWLQLPYHYLVGKYCRQINHLTIENCASKNVKTVREEIGLETARFKAIISLTQPTIV